MPCVLSLVTVEDWVIGRLGETETMSEAVRVSLVLSGDTAVPVHERHESRESHGWKTG